MKCDLYSYLLRLFENAGIRNAADDARSIASCGDTMLSLLQTDTFSLTEKCGCSRPAAELIHLVGALNSRRQTDKLRAGRKYSEDEIKDYLCGFFLADPVETVVCMYFDGANRFISTEYIADGTVSSSGFLPRKVFDIAARVGASSIILAHNHPRGIAKPSGADMSATASVASVGNDMGITLRAHYVVAGFDVVTCESSK